MKKPLLRIAVVLCALVVVLIGAWWVWRTWWSAEQLQAAITANDPERVKLLVRWGAPVDVDVQFKQAPGTPVPMLMCHGKPLHWAAEAGHLEATRLLLANSAEVNIPDQSGRTPLFWAVEAGHTDVAELLLGNRAKVDAKDTNYDRTPLHWVAIYRNQDEAKLLLIHDSDPNAKDRNGQTPIDLWPKLAEIVKQVEVEKKAKAKAKAGNQ